jgi:hypothetical protein
LPIDRMRHANLLERRLPFYYFTVSMRKLLFLVLVFGVFLAPHYVQATHLRAGEITVERLNCSFTFRITIRVYTDTGPPNSNPIRFGSGQLNFGDGSTPIIVPDQPNQVIDLNAQIATASYTIDHTYGSPGTYYISYLEPNRNDGVLNMDRSVDTQFYLETMIRFDPFFGCNSSPRMLVPPIDKACPGVAFTHNPGAFDPDGDSISFEMVVPKQGRNTPVTNYRDPNVREFYDRVGIPYNTANEDGNGPPSFFINPVTGTLTWDAPGASGEYNIAFIVKEWRFIAGAWRLMGYVTRDMQIIVEPCNNDRPDLIIPDDVCVIAGETLDVTIFGIDPNNDDVIIEAFSEVLNSPVSPATFAPNPPVRQPSSPNPAELQFTWTTDCFHIKNQPYQVVFKITDFPPNGPRLVTFRTWNITVVGPPPVWNSANVNLAQRSVNLNWAPYDCPTDGAITQIWRRVDSFDYTPDACETGMLDFMGYSLIQTVPVATNSYVDTNNGQGLDVGARYCYRLVVIFPSPKGGESIMSQEICIDPILADAPVITHVTVDETDFTNGVITVRWREPFDIDSGQFPGPYRYEVVRASGFTGEASLTVAGVVDLNTNPTAPLEWVDTGLNTGARVYNYRIRLIAPNGPTGNQVVDTSPVASSVRLESSPQFESIVLTWDAAVPWSNRSQEYPLHYIYRDNSGGATTDELTLIATVDVNMNGFTYTDEGLDDNTMYCYRVMTQGTYGNPEIDEPLQNFSQIICSQPNDDIPPCTPELIVELENCEDFFNEPCFVNQFSNTLRWTNIALLPCGSDVREYKIYYSRFVGGEFSLLATTTDTTFVHTHTMGLTSFAGCYRISAVDRSGNESPLSDPICKDNCPRYVLPNIFTPNGDGCNDVFSAYREDPDSSCGMVDRTQCARFVQQVEFVVYNRWGKEVYRYNSGGENSIFIDWDGRTNAGVELSSGIYYYHARVIFDVVDRRKREKSLKGWVEIKR